MPFNGGLRSMKHIMRLCYPVKTTNDFLSMFAIKKQTFTKSSKKRQIQKEYEIVSCNVNKCLECCHIFMQS